MIRRCYEWLFGKRVILQDIDPAGRETDRLNAALRAAGMLAEQVAEREGISFIEALERPHA